MPETIQIISDEWLSNILKLDVYKLVLPQTTEKITKHSFASLKNVLSIKPVFVYSKVPVHAISQVIALEKAGFHIVDTNIRFIKTVGSTLTNEEKANVRFARPEDKEKVQRIAHESFQYSRFHLDPAISMQLANRIKAIWAGNYFSGDRGDAMVIVEIGGHVAGFLQLLFVKSALVIDLIAVDSEHRRKNIARSMIAFAEKKLSRFDKIIVGTQAANLPSIRLYEKIGFRIDNCQHSFHYHNP